jgi:hypothetical protein
LEEAHSPWRGALYILEGARVKDGATCGFFLEEGAHHHLWEEFLRGGRFYKGNTKARKGSKIKKRKG